MFLHAVNNYSLALLFVLYKTWVTGLSKIHWSFSDSEKVGIPWSRETVSKKNTPLNSNPCYIYSFVEVMLFTVTHSFLFIEISSQKEF
jgi:hypothetical protein